MAGLYSSPSQASAVISQSQFFLQLSCGALMQTRRTSVLGHKGAKNFLELYGEQDERQAYVYEENIVVHDNGVLYPSGVSAKSSG